MSRKAEEHAADLSRSSCDFFAELTYTFKSLFNISKAGGFEARQVILTFLIDSYLVPRTAFRSKAERRKKYNVKE